MVVYFPCRHRLKQLIRLSDSDGEKSLSQLPTYSSRRTRSTKLIETWGNGWDKITSHLFLYFSLVRRMEEFTRIGNLERKRSNGRSHYPAQFPPVSGMFRVHRNLMFAFVSSFPFLVPRVAKHEKWNGWCFFVVVDFHLFPSLYYRKNQVETEIIMGHR